MRIAELDMHPLDALDRQHSAQDDHGLGMCNITKCCTEVCPEHIKITDNALIPMKERVVDRKYDPLVWLGNKIRRRPSWSPGAPGVVLMLGAGPRLCGESRIAAAPGPSSEVEVRRPYGGDGRLTSL